MPAASGAGATGLDVVAEARFTGFIEHLFDAGARLAGGGSAPPPGGRVQREECGRVSSPSGPVLGIPVLGVSLHRRASLPRRRTASGGVRA
jgi:hypothetical protein